MDVVTVPDVLLRLLRNGVAASNLLLVSGSLVVLLLFVYKLCLRRVWRARRIANLRLKRMLSEKESDDQR